MYIYLIGIVVTAVFWYVLLRARMKGFRVPLPEMFGGNLLDPINIKKAKREDLLVGWVLISLFWPIALACALFGFAVVMLMVSLVGSYNFVFKNEKILNFFFGDKK